MTKQPKLSSSMRSKLVAELSSATRGQVIALFDGRRAEQAWNSQIGDCEYVLLAPPLNPERPRLVAMISLDGQRMALGTLSETLVVL
jgi:hypothetical protein